jgi:DNA-binding NarL/FixJ family response regulator
LKQKKIFVVDANPIVRFGIVQLLKSEKDFSVCGQADNGGDALVQIQRTKPDILVASATFRRADGLELVKNLRKLVPALPVLIMASHTELVYADRVLRAGAKGYFEMSEPVEDLLKAIRCLLKGEVYLSKAFRSKIINPIFGKDDGDCLPLKKLSDRELEVFRLLGQGHNARQIAQQMYLSVSTVETHRSRIKEKLGANSLGEVMKHAFHWSILQQLAP